MKLVTELARLQFLHPALYARSNLVNLCFTSLEGGVTVCYRTRFAKLHCVRTNSYPCLCLCFLVLQIQKILPLLLTILQCRHIFFTEALTFIPTLSKDLLLNGYQKHNTYCVILIHFYPPLFQRSASR